MRVKQFVVSLLAFCFFLSAQSISQTASTGSNSDSDSPAEQQSDTAALAVAQRSLASMSTASLAPGLFTTLATAVETIHGTDIPVTYKTKGMTKARVEAQKPKGLGTYVLNNGRGQIRQPDGSIKELFPTNTIAQRVSYIPALSIISEYQNASRFVNFAPAKEQRAGAQRLVVNLEPDQTIGLGRKKFREMTQTKFDVDDSTGLVTRMIYLSASENDPSEHSEVEIRYSDYRLVSGVQVPFRQETLVDGQPESVVVLKSVTFNVELSDSEFELSEVKNAN